MTFLYFASTVRSFVCCFTLLEARGKMFGCDEKEDLSLSLSFCRDTRDQVFVFSKLNFFFLYHHHPPKNTGTNTATNPAGSTPGWYEGKIGRDCRTPPRAGTLHRTEDERRKNHTDTHTQTLFKSYNRTLPKTAGFRASKDSLAFFAHYGTGCVWWST